MTVGKRMNYSISKKATIDALNLADDRGEINSILDTIDIINTLPPTCQLFEDGTLIITVPNLSAVHRVIVDEENSQYCKTFYQDGDEDDKPVYDCMTCRHADRMPRVYPCSECEEKYSEVPSKWEPKEVENGKTD